MKFKPGNMVRIKDPFHPYNGRLGIVFKIDRDKWTPSLVAPGILHFTPYLVLTYNAKTQASVQIWIGERWLTDATKEPLPFKIDRETYNPEGWTKITWGECIWKPKDAQLE